MTARLRELAGDWIAAADAHSEQGFPAAADVGRRCADELLSILDADERPRFARSDGVSDADVEAAAETLFDAGWDSPADNSLGALRAALTHFAKGERHE